MQLPLEIPDHLAQKLDALPDATGPVGQRLGVAKGKFEVPDTIDAHNAEVARLFLRNSSTGDQT